MNSTSPAFGVCQPLDITRNLRIGGDNSVDKSLLSASVLFKAPGPMDSSVQIQPDPNGQPNLPSPRRPRETSSISCTLLYLRALQAPALIWNDFVLLPKAWPNNSEYKRQTSPGVCNLEKTQKERNLVLISTSAPPLGAGRKLTGPGHSCKETPSDVPSRPVETLLSIGESALGPLRPWPWWAWSAGDVGVG